MRRLCRIGVVAERLPLCALRAPRRAFAFSYAAAGTTMTTTRTSSSLSASTSSSSSSSSPTSCPKGRRRGVFDVVVRDGRRAMETASTGLIETPGARAQRHPTHEEMARFGRVQSTGSIGSAKFNPIGVNGSKVNCHSPGACKERFKRLKARR